jgi:putative ABC transport system permease protein
MLADLRFALRLFARSPLFTAAVVLVLGLGVGAATTVFTLVDAYLLKPLPFPEPERLVTIWRSRRPTRHMNPFSMPDLVDLRAQATASFSHLASMRQASLNLSGGDGAARPERVEGSWVGGEFFALHGVNAALGQAFGADDERAGRRQVVVLSDALWRRRFGADPGVLGRTTTLDGKPYEIVAVMPPAFTTSTNIWSADASALWLPEPLGVPDAPQRGSHGWCMVGRLRPGASFEAADAEVEAVAKRLEQAYPDTNTNKDFFLHRLQDDVVRSIRPSLTMLFAATLVLLVIASANVALLLLARASTREGEAAVRASLGATRLQLVRQFLLESVLLALLGGAVGFGFSLVSVRLVAAGFEGTALSPGALAPDGQAFAFALALASLAGLGFGLWPALRTSRTRLYELLKEGAARSTAGAGRQRAQGALLVAEIALAAVLLVGSVAVARGFYQTLHQPLGFSTESALTFDLNLPESRYRDNAAITAFQQEYLARLRATPSVLSAGITTLLPLGGSVNDNYFQIEGKPPWPPGQEEVTITYRIAGDFLPALGVPLLRGRLFADADREGAAPVMLVSESFVQRFLPGEEPIGKRVRWGREGRFREIVGVVGDVRHNYSTSGIRPASYIPYGQGSDLQAFRQTAVVLRTGGPPHAVESAARAALRELDADLPLADVRTYDELQRAIFADRRFTLVLVSTFAASALVLTALGLFGLVSYQTRRRSRELAIRMALGAAASDVQRLVLRDTSRLLLAGLALGLPAAFAAGRLLAAKLEGVPPADPLSLVGTALVLGFVGLAAVAAPARRAARTPPALVLRDE